MLCHLHKEIAQPSKRDKPKVLFLATVYGHLAAFHIPFMLLLKDMGYEVYAAACFDGREDEVKSGGITCWNVSFARSPYNPKNLKAFLQLKDLFESHHFDLIHVHTPVAAFLGRYLAKKTGQGSVLYTAHGLHFYEGAPLQNWLFYYPAEKLAAKWTDGLIVINQEDLVNAEKLLGFHEGQDLFFVHGVGVEVKDVSCTNSVYPVSVLANKPCSISVTYSERQDNFESKVETLSSNSTSRISGVPSIREELGIGIEDVVVACIGEINRNKNQSFLVRAWKNVTIERPNVHLLLIGDGQFAKKLHQLVRKEKIPNVHFLGFRNDVPNILNEIDIVVHVSKREGLPRVIMEAMAASKPVVATEIRGNRDLVEGAVNGLLVDIGDVHDLEAALLCLIDNPYLRVTMGSAGARKIQAYSIDNVMNEMKSIYSRFLSEEYLCRISN